MNRHCNSAFNVLSVVIIENQFRINAPNLLRMILLMLSEFQNFLSMALTTRHLLATVYCYTYIVPDRFSCPCS